MMPAEAQPSLVLLSLAQRTPSKWVGRLLCLMIGSTLLFLPGRGWTRANEIVCLFVSKRCLLLCC